MTIFYWFFSTKEYKTVSIVQQLDLTKRFAKGIVNIFAASLEEE